MVKMRRVLVVGCGEVKIKGRLVIRFSENTQGAGSWMW